MNWIFDHWKELVGYLAPIFIILSMMQSRLKTVRIFMILGCIVFIIYGLLVGALPVALANALIGVVTAYYLWKTGRDSSEYHLVENKKEMIEAFLSTYETEIRNLFPAGLEHVREGGFPVFLLMQKAEIIGLTCYRPINESSAELLVDYIIPSFRDEKSEKLFYDKSEGLFKIRGFKSLFLRTDQPKIIIQLSSVGFIKSKEDPYSFQKNF